MNRQDRALLGCVALRLPAIFCRISPGFSQVPDPSVNIVSNDLYNQKQGERLSWPQNWPGAELGSLINPMWR